MLLSDLALIHNSDSYVISLEDVPPSRLRILRIVRYPNNEDSPVAYVFRDLDYDTKKAVIAQCNRRHKGKTILI